MQKQEQGMWCWAAVAASIANFYDGTAGRQCDLANQEFSQSTCCSEPDASDGNVCNRASDMEISIKRVNHHASTSDTAATFKRVQDEIVQNRLIALRIEWQGQSVGHAVILDGYSQDSDGQWVLGDDPGNGDSFAYTYEEFKNRYGDNKDGSWDITYFTR